MAGIHRSRLQHDISSHVNETDQSDNSVSRWEVNLQLLVSYLSGNMTVALDGKSAIPNVTSNLIGALNASSNISMTMDNVATGLTNYFRDSSNITIAGQSGQVEFYIHVSWRWITLPAFLITGGTFFSMLAIFESKRCGTRIWKTSALPLLFHGFEERDHELNKVHKVSEMEHVASGIRTKMVKTSGGGWVLRRHGN